MNIGEAAKISGVSAKMIRHYESVKLLSPAQRTSSGYRQYSESDVHTLHFIRRARDLGFSIEQIQNLVSLWQNRRRPSSQVRNLAKTHLEEIECKLEELQAIKSALEHLVHCCRGDDRPDCPILEGLAGAEGLLPEKRKSATTKLGKRQSIGHLAHGSRLNRK